MKIVADDRERPSGIPDLMDREADVDLHIQRLLCGDYVVNDGLTVERKTAHDFLVSLIDGRLFRQVAKLKKIAEHPLFVVEGNPFQTNLAVDPKAIRGAILAVQAIWYLPVLHSRSVEETARILITIGRQHDRRDSLICLRTGYRPRKFKSRQLFFLQGLPGVGKSRAKKLLDRFKTLSSVVNASEEELATVDSIGVHSARKLRKFLDR